MKKYRYSEIFGHTVQGEGVYTGQLTSWLRFYSCNLQCNGFGQENPSDPSTYKLPYELIDVSDITDINDLPVFEYGCDSSYSWSKKFRHLAKTQTAGEIVEEIRNVTRSEFNPDGLFVHPHSGQNIHMCFTGGEPIMSQHAIVDIIGVMKSQGNLPNYVTIETNGTQLVKTDLQEFIRKNYAPASESPNGDWPEREWFWSVSPKLFTTSGEPNQAAIKPDVVRQYADISDRGQLKFVVNGSDETWDEMERVLKEYRAAGITWDVWIMPVGATSSDQENIQAKICEQSFDRGYNFAPRVHAWIFDNVIGK